MTHAPLAIAADHPAFPGHFPTRPILPGVVLLDETLRAIRRMRAGADGCRPAGGTGRARIGSAKFLSFVVPGEPVRLECEASAGGVYRVRIYAGRAHDERLAMTGSIDWPDD